MAIDVYYEIWCLVSTCLNSVLGCDTPNWPLCNACVSCTYRLEGEKPLKYSMLTQMDANNSLKRVVHVHKEHDSNGHVISTANIEQQDECKLVNDYYLSQDKVDKYKYEAKKRLPSADTSVCTQHLPMRATC
jgi:hypothetical protein